MAELRCKRCNLYADITQMRYEKTGTYLICAACRGAENKPAPRKVQPLVSTPFAGAQIQKYQCTKCHYTFRRSPTHPVEKCPNCESAKLIKYEKATADDVIKMSEDKRFERL